MGLFVLARHAESELNASGRINGDPAVEVQLTAEGERQARSLGEQVANLPLGVCVHTRFGRTRDTAELALTGRAVPLRQERLLDDVNIGALEGETLETYRAWKHGHTRQDPFPGGESLDDAARRYADGFEALLGLPQRPVLAVLHEIPIRYALNAAVSSPELDAPVHEIRNCVPYLFDEPALRRAVDGIRGLVA
jgi:broad specificity phosphatase PhoE